MTIASLINAPGRCEFGFHIATQHPGLCNCRDGSEWSTFTAALKHAAAVSSDGLIHQTDMRPLIQGIDHKHRGSCYSKARQLGLIELAGKEPSTDAAGRNTDKDQKVYRLRRAA